MSFPDPAFRYYVCATYPMRRGRSFTALVAGPFQNPNQASQERNRLRTDNRRSIIHCVEILECSDNYEKADEAN